MNMHETHIQMVFLKFQIFQVKIDKDFFDLEFEKNFLKSWLMVFRENEIPNPGDFKIFDKLQRDILIVRQNDYTKKFYNTCSHRGAPVVREKNGSTKLLKCQYHSWAYELDGSLLRVPDERDFLELDLSCKGLKNVHCDTWDGWIMFLCQRKIQAV